MTRSVKIVRNVLIGVLALAAVVLIGAIVVIHTSWFRGFAAQKIVSELEDSTGGRVGIGRFDFDPSTLRATIDNLVIHGREPAGAAPFVRVDRIAAEFRLPDHISWVEIDRPQVNVMVLPDGMTNIPSPKQQSSSNTNALQTVVDLAIDRFDLNNGVLAFESERQPLNVRGTNLRTHLLFDHRNRTYGGEISLHPLYVVSGRNTPVSFTITLPITIAGNRIDLRHASISSGASRLSIEASLANLKAPRITAQLNGAIALADLKSAGLPIAAGVPGRPSQLDLVTDVAASDGRVTVNAFHVMLGRSSIDASGASSQAIRFSSSLDTNELARLFKASIQTPGVVGVSGNLRLETNDRDITVNDLDIAALGGHLSGSAALRNFERYNFDGQLRGFDIANVLRAFREKAPYDGVVSGSVTAGGDFKTAGDLFAHVHLNIAPARHGKAVSGLLNANYDAASNDVAIEKSWVALPHTRLELNGSLAKGLNISLRSRDLSDLPVATPVTLNRGEASLTATLTGSLKTPRIAGHLSATHLALEGRQFDSFAADISASSSGAAVRNGILLRAPMQAYFNASVGLSQWKPLPREPLKASASLADGDLADIVALAGENPSGYSGTLTANVNVSGTIGNPIGKAGVQAMNGQIAGRSFDQANLQVNFNDRLVTIPAAYIQGSAGRVDLNAEFRHPQNSFTAGQLRASLKSTPIDLAKTESNASGTLQLNADIAGDLNAKQVQLTNVSADVNARALRFDGTSYGDLQAVARTANQTVTYTLTSDFAGSNVHVSGLTQLNDDYRTAADATIANLDVAKVLTVARRTDIPARGTLTGSLHVTGTIRDPQAEANIDLTRGALYDEPIDELRLRASYLARSIDVPELRITSGPSRIQLTAHYDHPAGTLTQGNAAFNLESSRIDLARVRNIQARRPGLTGTLQLTASGDGAVITGQPYVRLRDLKLNLAATGLAAQGKNFGDLKLTANSAAGDKVELALDSNLADASIHARGSTALTAGYPVDAQLTFNNVLYSHFASLLGTTEAAIRNAEVAADGSLNVNGPLLNRDQIRASLQLTRLNLTANSPAGRNPIAIVNQGPMRIGLDRGVVRIESAHLSGAGADVQAGGTASLVDQTLALTLNGKVDLSPISKFDEDIYSSGQVSLATTIRGSFSQPLVNGQMTLQNAAFNYAALPVGISNANGEILFNGNSASIRSLTAEAGGGRVTITGYAGYAGGARFGVQLKATRVRAQLQPGVSVTTNGDIQLAGTSANSVVSGSAVIQQITYNPRTDIGSLLSQATPDLQSAAAPSPLLEKMKLDIRVRASSGLLVQASLARNLSINVDLHVQGSAARPGVLGRITINDGQLVFFGSTYTVNTGTVAFYNPLQIDPNVDFVLETQAQGVDVTVRVTGPIDNLKMNYTSNPPLPFQQVMGLLAAGQTPTSDPTLLANQGTAPSQSFQQMGESAALGQAVANPVANRLQRVFGVSQLNIAPSFQQGSQTPTARLTLQQRITSNLTFTYTSALDDPNGQIIQVQWTFDPKWSAVATRDQNGIFSINFLYKRQFR